MNKKSLDEIRDELVDTACARWANWRGLSTFEKKQLQNDFQAMFNTSTKIHQEKYDALMREAMKLRDKLSLIYTEGPISTNAFLVNEARYAICPFDKFLQELEK